MTEQLVTLKKKRSKLGFLLIFIVFIVISIGGLYIFYFSQDFKKGTKDFIADTVGLDRTITHCLPNGTCKTWKGKFKLFPFPGSAEQLGGGGSSFQFFYNGKKIICGPGWIVEED